MRALTSTIQDDERGKVVYSHEDGDHAVYSPDGQFLGYGKYPQDAQRILNDYHYQQAQERGREAVVAALVPFIDSCDRALATYVGRKDLTDDEKFDRKYWRSEQAAFAKAVLMAQAGIVVTPFADGYLIPSSDGRDVYRLTPVNGAYCCTCEAGFNNLFCKHLGLLHGYLHSVNVKSQAEAA